MTSEVSFPPWSRHAPTLRAWKRRVRAIGKKKAFAIITAALRPLFRRIDRGDLGDPRQSDRYLPFYFNAESVSWALRRLEVFGAVDGAAQVRNWCLLSVGVTSFARNVIDSGVALVAAMYVKSRFERLVMMALSDLAAASPAVMNDVGRQIFEDRDSGHGASSEPT